MRHIFQLMTELRLLSYFRSNQKPQLSSEQRNDSVNVSISNISNNGNVDGFHVEVGGGSTTIVGDTLMIDNSGTGGNGASGVVTHVSSADGVASVDAAFQPKTAVLSRRQLIHVNQNVAFLTFPAGYIGRTSGNLGFIVEMITATVTLLSTLLVAMELINSPIWRHHLRF